MNNLNLCLGIDFGTTNSCLSVWYNNKNIIIPDIDGSNTIASVIEINDKKKIIGKEAYMRKNIFEKTNINNNENKSIFLVYEIKKLLGKKYSELNKEMLEMLAYSIVADENDYVKIYNEADDSFFYPEEIATQLFMSFKHKSEIYLSKKFDTDNKDIKINIKDAVISVPAYFNKNQREIIKTCAEMANLNVLRLINEPTAAALCYGLGKNMSKSSNVLVYDFGGGTLDISLLNISEGVFEVLGSCGNSNLGGSDFDRVIMEYCIKKFIETKLFIIKEENKDKQEEKDTLDNFMNNIKEENLQKLKFLAEQAKITLTENLLAKIKINNFYNYNNINYDLVIEITREKFNEICQDLINFSIKPLNDILDICSIEKSEIDEIIMVGGMTRIPIIRYNVERFFNKDVNCSIDPDSVVSIGAAIHGHMINNKDNLEDKLLLIDRTSLSIGVETSGGIMDILIPRGTIIPVKKYKKYTTDTDYVDSIIVKIYEGERKLTKNNFLIGNFVLSGIEKEKRGIPEIQITFEIDSDGIIKIKAEDLNNSLNKKVIQISSNKNNLSEEELNKIIDAARQMDEIDRIDKYKKESYLQLKENCKRILENLVSEELKITETIKNDVKENVEEIETWLDSTNYEDIEIAKYKELLTDFKTNYSMFIIINSNLTTKNLDSADNHKEIKGIEIYDEELDNKKYVEHIKYIRNIIDELNDINKELKIFYYQEKINIENINNDEKYNNIKEQYDKVNELANDLLVKFFIEKALSEEYVIENMGIIKTLYYTFKEDYNEFSESFNIFKQINKKIKEKEDKYIGLLDELNENINNNINNKINNEETNKKIQLTNGILDLLIDYDSIIYKMNNGYEVVDNEKLNIMLEKLNNL
jgi:molecular chaperone DnaK (HSP70)